MRYAPGVAAAPSDYAELRRRVREAGLLRRQPSAYVIGLAANVGALALCVAGLARFHQPWAVAALAVALGLVCGQLGFQLHDAGHHQMFERAWANRLVGFVTAYLELVRFLHQVGEPLRRPAALAPAPSWSGGGERGEEASPAATPRPS